MGTHIKRWITRFRAVSGDNIVLGALSEKLTLLQVLWEVIGHNEFALENPLRSCMGTTEAVPMKVVLESLNVSELLCHGLNVFGIAV